MKVKVLFKPHAGYDKEAIICSEHLEVIRSRMQLRDSFIIARYYNSDEYIELASDLKAQGCRVINPVQEPGFIRQCFTRLADIKDDVQIEDRLVTTSTYKLFCYYNKILACHYDLDINNPFIVKVINQAANYLKFYYLEIKKTTGHNNRDIASYSVIRFNDAQKMHLSNVMAAQLYKNINKYIND